MFSSTALGNVNGMTTYSVSFWYNPSSPTIALDNTINFYNLFRVTTDYTDETQSTLNGIRLGLSYSTDTTDPYSINLIYSKLPNSPSNQVNNVFGYSLN